MRPIRLIAVAAASAALGAMTLTSVSVADTIPLDGAPAGAAFADDTTPTLEPIIQVDEKDYQTAVEAAVAAKVAPIIKFSALDCGPCQQMKPVIQRLAKADGAKTWQLLENTGRSYSSPTPLARKFGVRGVPALAAMKDKDKENGSRMSGWNGEASLNNWIKSKVASFNQGN